MTTFEIFPEPTQEAETLVQEVFAASAVPDPRDSQEATTRMPGYRPVDQAETNALIEKGRAGDIEALGQAWSNLEFGVKVEAARFGDDEVRDELIGRIAVKFIAGVKTYKHGYPSAWANRIAHNTGIDWIRTNTIRDKSSPYYGMNRTVPILESEESEFFPQNFDRSYPHTMEPEFALEEAESEKTVATVLGLLSDTHRDILVDIDLNGLSNAEYAEKTGQSPELVKALLYRARNSVRKLVKKGLVDVDFREHTIQVADKSPESPADTL